MSMWLVNTAGAGGQLRLEKHNSSNPPPYAALSHRWTSGEVDFDSFRKGLFDRDSLGYRKILEACRLTRRYNLRYLWIDTCCIDKKNNSEYDVSIKSMFKWYERAEICIAHLSDVHSRLPKDLYNSEWFERGWTLQELIAPRRMQFYNRYWKLIGSRADLSEHISRITRISQSYLEGRRSYTRASIAERLSWAAGRKTTYDVDRAYCLMGLLEVTIPADYSKCFKEAWHLLQLEILKHSNDESIFAWTLYRPDTDSYDGYEAASACSNDNDTAFGLLAQDPMDFLGSRNIRAGGENTLIYSHVKRVLQIVQMTESKSRDPEKSFREHLELACVDASQAPESGNRVSITLQKVDGLWYRVDCFRPLRTGHWKRRASRMTAHRQEFFCESYPGVHKTSLQVQKANSWDVKRRDKDAYADRTRKLFGASLAAAALFGVAKVAMHKRDKQKEKRRRNDERLEDVQRSTEIFKHDLNSSKEQIDRIQDWARVNGGFTPHRLSEPQNRLRDRSDGDTYASHSRHNQRLIDGRHQGLVAWYD